MLSIRMCFSVFLIVIGVGLTKCDCDTFYECASGFFNDFFNRFAVVNSKTIDRLNPGKGFLQNDSALGGFHVDNANKLFEKIFPDSINLAAENSEENATDTLEFFKLDVFVPNINTTVLIKTIEKDLSDATTNVSRLNLVAGAGKVDVENDITFSIMYNNDTINYAHGDLTETPVKANSGNIEHHVTEDSSHSLSVLDKILRDYEDYYPDNSTDYSTIDYVEMYADGIEPVEHKTEYVLDRRTSLDNKNIENHTGELKQDSDNFIDDYDTSFNNDDHYLVEGSKKDRGSSRNVTGVENSTKLRVCDDNEFGGEMEEALFSWTVAIFLKESNYTDFSYGCDGLILSKRHIITAKKCFNFTSKREDVLIVAGKRSLRSIGEREAAYKTAGIAFQNGTEENNLAILKTETDIEFNEYVKSMCIPLSKYITDANDEKTIGVGYNSTNDLIALTLVENSGNECLYEESDAGNRTREIEYCVNVEKADMTCPNLGSAYVSITTVPSKKHILAILTNMPDDCNKRLSYTSLNENLIWIEEGLST